MKDLLKRSAMALFMGIAVALCTFVVVFCFTLVVMTPGQFRPISMAFSALLSLLPGMTPTEVLALLGVCLLVAFSLVFLRSRS